MKARSLIPMLVAIPLLASSAFADGGTRGSGGSSVFIAGKWELADVFTGSKENPGDMLELSKEMLGYLEGVKELWLHYGIASRDYWNQVTGIPAEYRYVNELPCEDDGFELNDPGLQPVAYGCTKDGITYLKRDVYEQFSFRTKALALMHERFHAFNPNAPHEQITAVIRATETLIRIKEEQNAGRLRKLSKIEVAAIEAFYPNATLGCLRDGCDPLRPLNRANEKWSIWPNGGGVIVHAIEGFPLREAQASVFIGVGSKVIRSRIAGSTVVLDSIVERTELRDSRIVDSFVRGTSVRGYPAADGFIQDSEIVSSKVYGSHLRSTRAVESVIDSSTLDAAPGKEHAFDLNQAVSSDVKIMIEGARYAGGQVRLDAKSALEGIRELQIMPLSRVTISAGNHVGDINKPLQCRRPIQGEHKFASRSALRDACRP